MISSFFKKTSANTIKLISEGEAYYEQYLNLIKNSQKSIHLQTYIFEDDKFGRAVITELIGAAQRQVKVYVLVDSLGSLNFGEKPEKELLNAGVYFSRFNFVQFKWLGQWGRRLHHKILLADNSYALIGGINVISKSYKNEKVTPQLDFAVYIDGPATVDLTRYCQLIFSQASQKKINFSKDTILKNPNAEGVELKISINDWIYQRWQITRQYSVLTQAAKKDIIILNSYFFPRRKFMKQLVQAARRGVRVRLILPKISDWPSYVLATQYLYAYFLRNGVEIYQWKKSIMHGKLATIDNTWTSIGSFNLNYTGYQQNLEMNVDVYSGSFTEEINEILREIIKNGCEKIEAAEFIEKAPVKIRLYRFFCYVILQMVANLSIGLAFQEEARRNRYYKVFYISTGLLFFLLGILGFLMLSWSGVPFFILSFLLLILQIKLNNKNV